MVAHAYNRSTFEFKLSLIYRLSSRLAKAIQGRHEEGEEDEGDERKSSQYSR